MIYTLAVEHSRNSLSKFGFIFLSLTCSHENVDKVIESVFHHLDHHKDDLQIQETKEKALSTVSKQLGVWHEKAMLNNSYWLFWLLDAHKRHQVKKSVNNEQEQQEQQQEQDEINWIDCNISLISHQEKFQDRLSSVMSKIDQVIEKFFMKERVSLVMVPKTSKL